ncbi:MAG TPA: GspH/FimT family pseudopilin [Gallionella sp.]|nr:GspH/FimT family pseudopilin [Gallionella sp.]
MSKSNIKSVQRRRNRGFTLVELLVTVVVAGIFAVLALPSMASFIAGQRVKTAAFDMNAGLTRSRSEAIERNTNVILTPATGGWQNGWTVAAGAVNISKQDAFTGLTVDCWVGGVSNACPANINYAGSGRLDSSSPSPFPSFRIFNAANTTVTSRRCISIDLSGRANSKQGNC